MPILIAPEVEEQIRLTPGLFGVQVREPSDPEAAVNALQRARVDIANLDGGWESAPGLSLGDRNGPTWVSAVMPTPSGPVISVDGGHTPRDLLATIPGLVAHHLAQAGMEHALVGLPVSRTRRPLIELLDQTERAAVLHLFPPPKDPEIPDDWLKEAATWVTSGMRQDDQIWASRGLEFPLRAEEALDHLRLSRKVKATTSYILAGRFGSQLRGANGRFLGVEPSMVIAGGGQGVDDQALSDVFDSLRQVARRLAAQLAHAYISFDASFRPFGSSVNALPERPAGNVARAELVESLCDEAVFDGFPYQVVGPGHMRRFSGLRRAVHKKSLRALEAGRLELSIGEPTSWLMGSPHRPRMQRRARKILAPCLLKDDEALQLVRTRLTP